MTRSIGAGRREGQGAGAGKDLDAPAEVSLEAVGILHGELLGLPLLLLVGRHPGLPDAHLQWTV